MARKQYTLDEVFRSLGRKNEIKVLPHKKLIIVLSNAVDVGNSTWGKIDFLSNHHHYRISRPDKFDDKL